MQHSRATSGRLKRLVLGAAVIVLSACGGGGTSESNGSGGTSQSLPAGTPPSLGGGGGTIGGGGGALATAAYTLSWNAVNDPNVTGYRIYFDVAQIGSGSTPIHVDVSSSSVAFQPGNFGVAKGSTVYVAVASIGSGGLESPISGQVSIVAE